MKKILLCCCLVFAQAACGKNVDASAKTNKCDKEAASDIALQDYRAGRFADAIEHAQKRAPCEWQDWQLIFNSYMVLSLQHPSAAIKQAALSKVAEFQRQPTWFADPGPLLVVLGNDEAARNWYVSSMARLSSTKWNAKTDKEVLRSRKLYFDAAQKLLESAGWSTLRIDEKLKRLTDAEMASVKKAKNP